MLKTREILYKVLEADERLWVQESDSGEATVGGINLTRLKDLVDRDDIRIINLLYSIESIRINFFNHEGSIPILKKREFKFFLEQNNLDNSYTAYNERIGLRVAGKLISDIDNVVLDFPYKDCVLEGGMNSEDRARKEIFYNSVIARDEIDRLCDSKALTNWKRYNKGNETAVGDLARDKNGLFQENLIIRGNNYLALHSLLPHYRGKVKLIYIDPPYNTRSDANTFAYNNNFNHSTWLTFMKNRLEIAKEFLAEDGVIFIDIDHNELFYLGVLADEIFGRENRLGVLAVVTFLAGRFNYDAKFSNSHENKLVYAKCIKKAKINGILNDNFIDKYPLKDEISYYNQGVNFCRGYKWKRSDRPNLFYPIYIKLLSENSWDISLSEIHGYEVVYPIMSNGTESIWRWSKDRLIKDWKNEILIKKLKNNQLNLYIKSRYYPEYGKKPKTIWLDAKYQGSAGTATLTELFDEKVFPYPKSVELVKDAIIIASDPDSIIMDFFAGSGTTGHAVLELNKADNGNRKFILIEQMDYIENVTKERIRRVIELNNQGNFVYCELAKYNQTAIETIQKMNNSQELISYFYILQEKYFLHYNLEIKLFLEKLKNKNDDFHKFTLENQKRTMIETLDLNQLYVNFSERHDKKFNLSPEDIYLSEKFYEVA